MNSCMGTYVALSIFCLNIALPCSPLNTFETWADQQELSKEARCKSAFSTRRRVSLLKSSMLLTYLMESRNQKNCKGFWTHPVSTAQFVMLFFTPRMRLKEHRCLSSVTGYQIHCLHSDTLSPTPTRIQFMRRKKQSVLLLWLMLPNLFIPDVPFLALLSTFIRKQFQVKPATPLDRKRKERLCRQWKSLPTIIKEKEPPNESSDSQKLFTSRTERFGFLIRIK
jgi:hypothetical protein